MEKLFLPSELAELLINIEKGHCLVENPKSLDVSLNWLMSLLKLMPSFIQGLNGAFFAIAWFCKKGVSPNAFISASEYTICNMYLAIIFPENKLF